MYVLGIAGSPRKDGNTDILLERVLAGAAEAGVVTKTIVLRSLKIEGCRHCDGCLKTGECVVKDDMQDIYPELRKADRLVIAAPVFFMGPPAQLKAMIDRCQALWSLRYVLKKPVALNDGGSRKALYISVGGTKLRDLFLPSITILKSWLLTLQVTYSGELVFPGVDEAGAIRNHPTALQDAFEAGRKLVAEQ